jgi:putative tryptophan/tyrosine transport system substrate-binding protein
VLSCREHPAHVPERGHRLSDRSLRKLKEPERIAPQSNRDALGWGAPMTRRGLIALLAGAAAASPRIVRAQQPALPVVGYLGTQSPEPSADRVRAFIEGLGDTGHLAGQNVAIEYRWAQGQDDRLPGLAAELVGRQVAVIAAPGGLPAARAAKAATSSIPIVFEIKGDPVEAGLVRNPGEPDGNLTGVITVEAAVRRLELLRELVPGVTRIGAVINPASPGAASDWRQIQAAARALGLRLQGLQATSERDFDAMFVTLARVRAGALLICADPFFTAQSEQLAAMTVQHALPAVHQSRRFASAGGLISYDGSPVASHRLVGVYCGRILNGDKPADLPIQQAVKGELVVNRKTAQALGLTVPPSLLALADEVID